MNDLFRMRLSEAEAAPYVAALFSAGFTKFYDKVDLTLLLFCLDLPFSLSLCPCLCLSFPEFSGTFLPLFISLIGTWPILGADQRKNVQGCLYGIAARTHLLLP